MQDPARWTNWRAIKTFVPTAHSDTYSYIAPSATDLSGKSVFVVGASRGIGRSIALSLAKAGAPRIAIGARSDLAAVEEELLRAASDTGVETAPQVLRVAIDVADADSVEEAAKTVAAAFDGVLDLLVINSGRGNKLTLDWATSPVADTWGVMETNFKGVYLCTRAFLPLVLRSPEATSRQIIVVGSAGSSQLLPGLFMYQTSKFALQRLIEFAAKDYEDQRLSIVGIHPGDVPTNILDEAGVLEAVRHLLKETPQLAGDTVVWLAKEKRHWLSGRFVSVTWDMKELDEKKADILNGDLLKFRLAI
ncbi:hypothetical protein BX600DRAFT_483616 [Xylariales sp. PMI_506]|nr:hypothetical protein BX600DRAFT_483616 [Xylariales sp. PMI_506]